MTDPCFSSGGSGARDRSSVGSRHRLSVSKLVLFYYNTSTAFSPTDVPVLAAWAMFLMMMQSLLSLLIIALLAARAVNIL